MDYFSVSTGGGEEHRASVEKPADCGELSRWREMASNLGDQTDGFTDYSDPRGETEDGFRLSRFLLKAAHDLESVQALLLNPDPERIRQAAHVLEQTAAQVRLLETEHRGGLFRAKGSEMEAIAFQATLRRVLALLQGAQRIQWHRMRRMGSYIETYTANGITKVCVHRLPILDFKA